MQGYGGAAGPSGAGTRAGLVLLYAPSFEQFAPAYLLSDADLIIGRDPASDICVPEAAVSRQHARVRYAEGHWTLRDLGGRNGTLVDGAFIEEVALEPLHEIRIGDAIFKYVEAGAESYVGSRIDGAQLDERGSPRPAKGKPRALVGGYQIDHLVSLVDRVAPSEISVVILGESGTGKEVLARHLHQVSGRRGAFQAINCAAIPPNLLESELFGYKRGAFTGADRDKPGLFRAADQGTVFLDEIGDLPLEAQAKLLRVLQSREVLPVGATVAERVDVRIVCATHRDLPKLQRQGQFRGDLYARLNEYSVTLPPLRERKEDIFMLCRALLARHGRPQMGMSVAFMTGLLHYDFPFNVRELESLIKRAIALCDGAVLDAPHLPDTITQLMQSYGKRQPASAHAAQPAIARQSVVPTEDQLRERLSFHRGNVAAVGREFGKERMQVHRWMKRYGITAEDFRK